jgi:uncharacterized protein YciI
MLFTITCRDKPEHLALRMSIRPSHIAHIGQVAADLVVAGPLLDAEGQPCGSMFVIELPDRAAAEAFVAADPYTKAGLFETTTILAFRLVFKDGAPV